MSRPVNSRKRTLDVSVQSGSHNILKAARIGKRKQHCLLLSLSDESLLKILGFLDLGQTLSCQQTCRRLYHLAGDEQIWRELYYTSFGNFNISTSRRWQPEVASSSSKPLDLPSKMKWKQWYKIQYNWRQGNCRVENIAIPTAHPESEMIIRRHRNLIYAAQKAEGLRIWRTCNGILLNEAAPSLDGLAASTLGYPTVMEIAEKIPYDGKSFICIGFSDGSVLLYLFVAQTRQITPVFHGLRLFECPVRSIAIQLPYLAILSTKSRAEIFVINGISNEEITDTSTLRIKQLSSIESHSARHPICLRMQSQQNLIVSLFYVLPNYLSQWSICAQEVTLSKTGELLKLKQARRSRRGNDENSKQRYQEEAGISRPHLVSYAHPWLVTAHTDNTMNLFFVESRTEDLIISWRSRLLGHYSRISGLQVSKIGRILSIGADVNDIQVRSMQTPLVGTKEPLDNLLAVRLRTKSEQTAARLRTRDFMSTTWQESKDELSPVYISASSDDESITLVRWTRGGEKRLLLYSFS